MPLVQRNSCSSLVIGMLFGCVVTSSSQQISEANRSLAQQMLRDMAPDVKKYYYDPKLHGVDWDAKVRQARENIDKANSMDSAVSEIVRSSTHSMTRTQCYCCRLATTCTVTASV